MTNCLFTVALVDDSVVEFTAKPGWLFASGTAKIGYLISCPAAAAGTNKVLNQPMLKDNRA